MKSFILQSQEMLYFFQLNGENNNINPFYCRCSLTVAYKQILYHSAQVPSAKWKLNAYLLLNFPLTQKKNDLLVKAFLKQNNTYKVKVSRVDTFRCACLPQFFKKTRSHLGFEPFQGAPTRCRSCRTENKFEYISLRRRVA